MAENINHQKGGIRWAVMLVSAVASIGIWAAVTKSAQPGYLSAPQAPDATVAAAARAPNPNFSNSDTFLTQSQVSTGPTAGRQPIAPATPTAKPRLRTRGS